MSNDEYFSGLEAVHEEMSEASSRLAKYDEMSPSAMSEQELEEMQLAFLTDLDSIVGDAVADIEGLQPPDEVVADAQAEYVDSLEEVVNLFHRAYELEQAGEDTTGFETALDILYLRRFERCAALQTLADERNVQVDLGCVRPTSAWDSP
jgi:glutathionylspermidine synthase